MENLSEYEKAQIGAIEKWKKEEPSVVSQSFGLIVRPLAWLVNTVVPESAVRGALDFSNTMAHWLTDTDDVIRDGGVSKLSDLRYKDLKLSDGIADEVHNWAIGLAVVEGAGTGFFGLPGMAVDIPAVITLALRTIHKIGVCYGYECKSELDQKFVYGIMSVSGANSISEKISALTALRSIEVMLAKVTWKKIAEKAAENQLGRETALLALRKLAKQIGVNITKRKALAAIPFIGAAIGGSVNGWYIKEVGWAAHRSFQERWLIENKKVILSD
jgi:hypothetical protein